MRTRRHAFAVWLVAGILAPASATAGPNPTYLYLTPVVGVATFDDFQVSRYASMKDALFVGGRVGWRLSPALSIEAAGGTSSTEEDIPNGAEVKYLHIGGDFRIHLAAWKIGGPFIGVGGSYTSRSSDAAPENLAYGAFDALAGWESWWGGRIGLRLEARNVLNVPSGDLGGAKENEVLYLGGLTLAFGGKTEEDSDADGVSDQKDQCPGTPAGAQVDVRGCPVDDDSDGVPNGIDECANSPSGSKVDAKGCPTDGDGDGVSDGLDKCEDTPTGATVDATGCPSDADGDKIWDGIDQCPNTTLGALVDEKGCPADSDGDGVFDGLDKCPGTAANLKVDKDGCPLEVTEKETELLDTGMIRLSNVNFETGKSDLMPESKPVLDTVGQVLSRWPDLRIEVGGHTDSRGSNELNQSLSDARAKSVLDYLIATFPELKEEQFVAKGYGESKPLVPNTNQLNMAKNRRVEFVVLNKDVLKREVEKRRMIEK
ncbi:MAG TPA: OmpA family protein [Candidatus Eisenbacteria bacterium]|nr:OmpA family protein [Candidatus Eisenbacteria bacterium]